MVSGSSPGGSTIFHRNHGLMASGSRDCPFHIVPWSEATLMEFMVLWHSDQGIGVPWCGVVWVPARLVSWVSTRGNMSLHISLEHGNYNAWGDGSSLSVATIHVQQVMQPALCRFFTGSAEVCAVESLIAVLVVMNTDFLSMSVYT